MPDMDINERIRAAKEEAVKIGAISARDALGKCVNRKTVGGFLRKSKPAAEASIECSAKDFQPTKEDYNQLRGVSGLEAAEVVVKNAKDQEKIAEATFREAKGTLDATFDRVINDEKKRLRQSIQPSPQSGTPAPPAP